VAASETIRSGLALILTRPFAAVSVTGNGEEAAWGVPAGVAWLAGGLLADGLLAEAQPASAATMSPTAMAAAGAMGARLVRARRFIMLLPPE